MIIRRWLANTHNGDIIAYCLDSDTKEFIPSMNLDICYMKQNEHYIKTGFVARIDAEKYLSKIKAK